MASLDRRVVVRGGASLLSMIVCATPLSSACFSSPEPMPPSTRRCDSSIIDLDRVTTIELAYARAVRGVQGGSHFELAIRVYGTGLSGCVPQSSVLTEDGRVIAQDDTPVRAEYEADGVLVTSPIYLFPPAGSRVAQLRVETLGATLFGVVDLDPFAGSPDAGR